MAVTVHAGKAVRPLLLAAVVCMLALMGCATTTYKPFETRGDAVFDGKGGVRSTQDGMDIWDFGDPPRRYKVLGIIDDERPGDAGAMSRLYGDVARKARDVGGHALIQVRNRSQLVGQQTTDNMTATAPGNPAPAMETTGATPVRKNTAQFLVIRYLD